jgi:hypothetical protein
MGKKAVVKKAKDDDALAAAYLETESYINDLVMERSHTSINCLYVAHTSINCFYVSYLDTESYQRSRDLVMQRCQPRDCFLKRSTNCFYAAHKHTHTNAKMRRYLHALA